MNMFKISTLSSDRIAEMLVEKTSKPASKPGKSKSVIVKKEGVPVYDETVTWRNSPGQSFKVFEVKEYLRTCGVTQETVNELFSYDPQTGIVTRKVFVSSRAKAGDAVGINSPDGYLAVVIAGRSYRLHRIIWLMVYGYLPENHIDHINRKRADNRLCNLREVTASCNMRNASMQSRNKTGVRGVCRIEKDKSWQVTISGNSRHAYIGRFSDFTEAVCHRYAAEQCLNYMDCDLNSPAFQVLKEMGIIK